MNKITQAQRPSDNHQSCGKNLCSCDWLLDFDGSRLDPVTQLYRPISDSLATTFARVK